MKYYTATTSIKNTQFRKIPQKQRERLEWKIKQVDEEIEMLKKL